MDDWEQQMMFQRQQEAMERQRQAEEEQRRLMMDAACEASGKARGNKKITYRPGKMDGIVGGIAGGVFALLGVCVIIPTFGVFGIVWTLFALLICGGNLYRAFGKKYVGPEIHVEDVDGSGASPEERLKQLSSLYEQRLITKEEYEQKRAEILKDL